MATHSSVLAWRIPGTGEPGGLPSMGSHRVGLSSSSSRKLETSLKPLVFKCFEVKLSLDLTLYAPESSSYFRLK